MIQLFRTIPATPPTSPSKLASATPPLPRAWRARGIADCSSAIRVAACCLRHEADAPRTLQRARRHLAAHFFRRFGASMVHRQRSSESSRSERGYVQQFELFYGQLLHGTPRLHATKLRGFLQREVWDPWWWWRKTGTKEWRAWYAHHLRYPPRNFATTAA